MAKFTPDGRRVFPEDEIEARLRGDPPRKPSVTVMDQVIVLGVIWLLACALAYGAWVVAEHWWPA